MSINIVEICTEVYNMSSDEMKHIFSLLFKAKNEKNSSLVADYLADEIIWHECDQNGKDLIVTWSKEKFIKGNFLGYPATGKNVRFYATYTVKFKNGLIAEIWAIADGLLALKQIGAIK